MWTVHLTPKVSAPLLRDPRLVDSRKQTRSARQRIWTPGVRRQSEYRRDYGFCQSREAVILLADRLARTHPLDDPASPFGVVELIQCSVAAAGMAVLGRVRGGPGGMRRDRCVQPWP